MHEELANIRTWAQAVEAAYLAVPTSARVAMVTVGVIGVIMVARRGRSSIATNAIVLGVVGAIGLINPTVWNWMAIASGRMISWGFYGLSLILIMGLGALALRPKPSKAEQARAALDDIARLRRAML